jgi:hypothetical protein
LQSNQWNYGVLPCDYGASLIKDVPKWHWQPKPPPCIIDPDSGWYLSVMA